MSKQTESTLKIDDMACSGCSDAVQQALEDIKGVEKVSADHEKGTASVSYNPELVSAGDFEQAVEDAGYTYKGMK